MDVGAGWPFRQSVKLNAFFVRVPELNRCTSYVVFVLVFSFLWCDCKALVE